MEKEIYYAIHEAIQVMEQSNTGEDFALVSSLRRMHELEQKLQAEGSDGVSGAAVASSAAGQNGRVEKRSKKKNQIITSLKDGQMS
jgi:hypothetical protein